MVYFGYHLVNPHVQTVQNLYGKGGQRVSKTELWPLKVDPYFERKKIALRGVTKSWAVTVLTPEQNPPGKMFEMYIVSRLGHMAVIYEKCQR